MHKLSNIRFNADKRDYAHLQIKRMLAAEYDYDTDIKPFENRLSRSVHPCTLLDASFCEAKTSLLRGTSSIYAASDTLRIPSSRT